MEKKQEAFCSLVEELLPLYQEHSIAEQTEQVIREHLEHCSSCREKNKEMERIYQQNQKNEGSSDVPLSVQEQKERGKFQALAKRFRQRRVRNVCLMICMAIALNMAYHVCFQLTYFDGESMSPTIQDDDRCLVSKVSYLIHAPKRNDIVMMWLDIGGERDIDIYRIVGVPGDEIEITDGHLLVNGKINKRYEGISASTTERNNLTDCQLTVPEGQYFFLGDHHELSYDSRNAGCVKRENLIGKVLTAKVPHFLPISFSVSVADGVVK